MRVLNRSKMMARVVIDLPCDGPCPGSPRLTGGLGCGATWPRRDDDQCRALEHARHPIVVVGERHLVHNGQDSGVGVRHGHAMPRPGEHG